MLSMLLVYSGVVVAYALNDTIDIHVAKNETMDIALPLTRCNVTLLDELCGFVQVVVCIILCIIMYIVKRDRLTNNSPYASTPTIEL
jgi:hypothetical protein